MKEKYSCPDCQRKSMTKLNLLERWWCTFCDAEIDVEKTIMEWANNGYQKETHDA